MVVESGRGAATGKPTSLSTAAGAGLDGRNTLPTPRREDLYVLGQRRKHFFCLNSGFRMDFLLLSAEATSRLIAAGVDAAYRGREKPSDHAPTWVQLSEASNGRRNAQVVSRVNGHVSERLVYMANECRQYLARIGKSSTFLQTTPWICAANSRARPGAESSSRRCRVPLSVRLCELPSPPQAPRCRCRLFAPWGTSRLLPP